MKERFFSIVIPAHNEESLIGMNLKSLKAQDYPAARYEVVVVENGSSDRTLELAKKFEGGNCKVFSIGGRGVSRARNFGLVHRSPQCQWSIVLDADTALAPSFLRELNDYLDAHPRAGYGMVTLTPDPLTSKSRFWFWYRNLNMRLIKSMDTIHVVRNDLLDKARYDEGFHFTEDLQYAESLRPFGEYFFMPTQSLSVSARRFERVGYLRIFLKNFGIGIRYALGKQRHKGKDWEVIR